MRVGAAERAESLIYRVLPKGAKFPIGTKYMTRGKNKHECTVIDIHSTFNVSGEMVKFRYVSTHIFCGQTMTNYDVPQASISLGMVQS